VFQAALALMTAVAAISWAAILIRWCDAPSAGIAFFRLLIATAVLTPFGLRGALRVPRGATRMTLAAGLMLAAHFAAWIASLRFTTVASSVTLVATQPVFAAALGPLWLGERPGRRGLAGVGLALAGVAVVSGGDWTLGARALGGDLLALSGALTGAAYLMIGRRVRAQVSFVPYLLAVNAATTVFLGLFAVLTGARLGGYPAATWLALVLLAAGPHLIGHGLLNWSVRRLRSFAVTLAVLGEPVLSTVYAALIFGELPGGWFYPGAALIAIGVLLGLGEEARRVEPPLPQL